MKKLVIVLMGVSGCGKTSVGRALAEELKAQFYDGDDFHPQANIAKMSQGIALTDGDRLPWLTKLNELIIKCLVTKQPTVIACSALKQSYRDCLLKNTVGVILVYLQGSYALILNRLKTRQNHFMQATMLQSQFKTLEEPKTALVVNIEAEIETVVRKIVCSIA